MKHDLKALNDIALRDLFAALCIQQGEAIDDLNWKKYNKIFHSVSVVANEMRERSGNARHLLLPFLSHQNSQVRLMAAAYTYAIAPAAARHAMEELMQTGVGHFQLSAGSFLRAIESGTGTIP
ncbi:MAG: DUF2019 domain-containing protein [Pseudomonadota bacterium]